jgi:3-oxoadipate enol-lactonase
LTDRVAKVARLGRAGEKRFALDVSGAVVGLEDVNLFARTYARRKRRPVVLLHALGETSASWTQVAPVLARVYQVHVLDLRGHGWSSWTGPYSLEKMSEDVLAFMDTVGLDRPHLVGHSLGGVLAYLLAERHPHRVGRLVLEDPLPPLPRPRTSPERPEGELNFDWDLVAPLVAQADDPPSRWWDDLTSITAPTLVIGGGPTSHVPQDQLAEMARQIPSGTFTTLDTGHQVHRARPGEVADLVMAFLAGKPAARHDLAP